MKKKTIVTLALVGLASLAAYSGAKSAHAEESDPWYPPIVDKLVARFGLNADEVKEVFDTQKGEYQAQMGQRAEDSLNQAVEDGTITEEQKKILLAKKEELRTQMGEMDGLSFEERKAVMKEHHEEMESWAEENGIDLPLFMGQGMKLGGRMGGFGGCNQ
ncbi:hypothetical protein MUP65_00350 [Patescibacteria group bacterium]|nr:hypothetical protein [Patescibacteria group bacterium]